MKKLNPVFITLLLMIPFPGFSQSWVEMMEKPDANFYDIQEKFEKYWEGRSIDKGKGWKPFKRWEYLMEPRVYPTGEIPDPDIAWKNYYEYLSKKQTTKNSRGVTANWTPLGPDSWDLGNSGYNPGNGRINCVEVDMANNIIYVGTPSGGLWKSHDGGDTWLNLTDDLPVIGVSGIAFAGTDTIYIATGDGDGGDTYSIGVLKSTDGGATWNTTGLNWQVMNARRTSKLLMHPDNSDILLVATSMGVYRTTDGGDTWSSGVSANIKDIEFKPGDPSVVYACGTSFYKSTNNGSSFFSVSGELPSSGSVSRLAIGVTPANPEYVYVLAGDGNDNSFYGLYRSTDGGNNFSLRSNSPNIMGYEPDGSDSRGQSYYDIAIAVSPTDADVIYTGGVNVWKSTSGGSSWYIVGYWYHPETDYPYVHADIHYLGFFGNDLYTGTDGGIFETTDGGSTWNDLSDGLRITQFYRIGGSATEPDKVCGGTQDNGSNLIDTDNWTHVFGADGMEAIIDPTNSNIIYISSQNGGMRKSYDGGSSFSYIAPSSYGAWVTPYVMHPEDPQLLFAAYEEVYRTYDGGSSWDAISDFNGYSLRSLAVADSDPDYIYTGGYNSLYMTSNGGGSWTSVSAGLPISSSSITYIAVDAEDPERVWISLSGYSDGKKVYESTDGGSSWTNISGTLPNLPANCIAFDKNTGGLYVGMDVGIYYYHEDLGDWIQYNDDLPNVIIHELEINYTINKIRAATHGRGIWESGLYIDTLTLKADFNTIGSAGCLPRQVHFDNSSFGSSNRTYKWYFGDGDSSSEANPVHIYNEEGSYSVTLIAMDSSGSDTLYAEDHIRVFSLEFSGLDSLYCKDDNVEVLSKFPEDGVIEGPGISGVIFSPIAAGSGTHTIKFYYPDENSACDTIYETVTVDLCNGINDPELTERLQVFPNPASDIITVKLRQNSSGPVLISVFNLLGKEISRNQFNDKGVEEQIDISGLPAGIYFIQVESGNEYFYRKFVKE